MKYYLITIRTFYSVEEYLVPVQEGETLLHATEIALSNIAFCDAWEIIGHRVVGIDYLKAVAIAQKVYLGLTGYSVAEVFTGGKYTTYEAIVEEIAEIKKGEQNNDEN